MVQFVLQGMTKKYWEEAAKQLVEEDEKLG